MKGVKYSENDKMRETVMTHFKELYEEEFRIRPRLDGLSFKNINMDSRQNIEAVFTEEEVLAALKCCNGDKAPRPDGFNMNFIPVYWDVIKDDVMNVFKEFHQNRKFVRSLNVTFFVLIAKKKRGRSLSMIFDL